MADWTWEKPDNKITGKHSTVSWKDFAYTGLESGKHQASSMSLLGSTITGTPLPVVY